MNVPKSCSRCGATLAGDLLEGLCPRCLAAGLAEEGNDDGYELFEELGRGGMGVVYLARQRRLDRLVAVKVLLDGAHAGGEAERRFLREAREAARLHHPHIVGVHDVGRREGRPFYAMELIEGEDLAAFVRRKPPGPREAAAIVAQAARAVQHAHEVGVLHRDLKPTNILIDARGEPHLTDFGLAAEIGGTDGLTRTGEILGSPGFMAPEQLTGAASTATDIYGLGAVLYFLLTGRAPFVAAVLPELLAAVARGDPLPPRRLDPSLPRDLETICLHALACEPTRRYADAGALAADLERWLDGRAIHARPTSAAGRLWRWSRRNRGLAILAASLVLVVLVGTVAVVREWRQAEHARVATVRQLYSADLAVASDALVAGDLGLARRTLERCPVALRDSAWGVLWPFTRGDAESEIGRAEGTVNDLAISRDGARVASAAQEDRVRVWDLAQSSLIAGLPVKDVGWWTEFSPDGRELFVASDVTKEWNLAAHRVVREFPGQSGALSPDGRVLYTCLGCRFVYQGEPGVVDAWRVEDERKLFELPVRARSVALSPDGAVLAVSDAESEITLYDAHDGHVVHAPWSSDGRLWSLTFSPDGALLVASGWSPDVRVWRLADLAAPPRRLHHPLGTWATAFNATGTTLAVACSDQQVHLWDARAWSETRTLRGHQSEVWSLAWQPDGRLLSAGRDQRVLRTAIAADVSAPVIRHDEYSYNIVWLPGDRLATVRYPDEGKEFAYINSLKTGKEENRFFNEWPCAYDARTDRLWLWSNSGEWRARRVSNLDDVVAVPCALRPEDVSDTPHVVPEAGLAWAALQDSALVVFRLTDGARIAHFEKIFQGQPRAAALSPDGRFFIWGGVPTGLHRLDLASGNRTELPGHHDQVAGIAFAPGGDWFVSGGTDGMLLRWDSATGRRLPDLGQHATSVGPLAFSPDGTVLFSYEPAHGIHIWHPATSRHVGFLPVNADDTDQWLGVAPDGRWLGLRHEDGRIQIFPLATSDGSWP